MKWFDALMWGWIHFYADLLTWAGLIGLVVCLVHGFRVFCDWVWTRGDAP